MTGRFWFYLAALIVIAGIGTTYLASARRSANERARSEAAAVSDSKSALAEYLSRQTDSRKLVNLAILYQKTRPELVEPVAVRAFELNKNSRDIALLASPYSEEAKERVKFLDPLYGETNK